MKQLTMTKVLTPLAALAFAFGVQAATVTDGFEAFDAGDGGTAITNATRWSFTPGPDAADDGSTIEAYPDAASKPSSYSEAFASAGDNYLKLSTEDGTLFRYLSDTTASATVGAGGLYVDTDVQFTVTDPSDSPTNSVDNADKLVIWLEDQGAAGTNLCVLGRQFGATSATHSDKVYTLSGSVAIVPGNWYRLTVKALPSLSLSGEALSYPAFQVFVNNQSFSATEWIVDGANESAFVSAESIGNLENFEPYIPARADTMTSLSQVGFSGEGAVDNIAISSDIPDFLPRQKVTVSWDTSIISAVNLYHGGEVTTLDAPGVIIVDSVTDITISNNVNDITFVGSSNYDFTDPSEWTKGGDVSLSLSGDGKVVTCAAGDVVGSFTIGVAANNTRTLTLTADNDANLSSVSYAITSGGVTGETQAISDLGELVLGGVSINCLVGDVVTFTVVPASGKTATLTPTDGTLSDNAFTVSGAAPAVAITTASSKASVDGVGYTSFANAFAAAKSASQSAGTFKTVVLEDAAELASVAEIVSGDKVIVDLAGNDITGLSGATAVFSIAAGGELTITNSTVEVGAVTPGAATAFIVNNGTLNLNAGNFGGAFTGSGATYVNGGAYNATAYASLSNATLPPGMALADNGGSGYVYELAVATFTVTFDKNNEDATGTMADQTFTYNVAQTLTANAFALDGYDFAGWNTQADGNGTDYADEASVTLTSAGLTLYAKWTQNAPTTPTITPTNSTETAASYTQAQADSIVTAINNAKSTYIVAPEGIAAGDYSAKFEAKKVLDEGSGNYKVVVELTSAATIALTTDAGDQAATLAGQLSTVAATASATEVALTGAEPGFYYSVGYATTVGGTYTEGARAMAAADGTVSLPIPAKANNATAGFYKVFVNIADK